MHRYVLIACCCGLLCACGNKGELMLSTEDAVAARLGGLESENPPDDRDKVRKTNGSTEAAPDTDITSDTAIDSRPESDEEQ